MNLKDWLDLHNISVAEAAQEIGYSRQRLYQVINMETPAGAELIRAILKYTNDEVSVQSLLTAKTEKRKKKEEENGLTIVLS